MEEAKKGVAEMLREAYEGPGCTPKTIARTVGLEEPSCCERGCGACLRHTLSALANMVDAEVAEAREASAREGMAVIAAAEGWPALRDGESVTEWMDRAWLPRPRYKDGEPVEIGSRAAGLGGPVEGISIRFDEYGAPWYSLLDGVGMVDGTGPFERMNVALDADGVEVKDGDTVWFCGDDTGAYTVSAVEETLGGGWCLTVSNDAATIHEVRPSQVTHREPDSLEKLLNRMEDYAQKYEGYVDGSKVGDFSKELRALIERDA